MQTVYTPDEPGLSLAQNRKASTMAQQLTTLLSNSKGQMLRAVQAVIWRIGAHPKQVLEAGLYTELSVGYIAKAAGVGWETARRAWHRVRGLLDWVVLTAREASEKGVSLRKRPKGGLWGQHLQVRAEVVAAAIRACVNAKISTPHLALPDGEEWMAIQPQSRGRHLVACCPWHDDQNPSLIMYPNEDEQSGSAICMACTRDGHKLTAYWRSHQGAYKIRLSRRLRDKESGLGTIHNPKSSAPPAPAPAPLPLVPPPSGAHLLWKIGAHGSHHPSRRGSLDEILRSTPSGEAEEWAALAGASKLETLGLEGARLQRASKRILPDLYVSLDEMKPKTWKENPRRPGSWLPDRWTPVRTTHVAVDLDGFSDAPWDSSKLQHQAQLLEELASLHPCLSGGVTITRTSHHGLQLIFRLKEEQHPEWKRSPASIDLHETIEQWSLTAAHEAGFVGGHADPTARQAGRLIRRPGSRFDKHGNPFVSRVIHSTH